MSKKYAEVNVVKGKTQALTEEQQNCNILCVTMFEDERDKRIADLEAKLAEHNEYFRSFSCENFNEFQDFISTFMLTPHEKQTLIKELKQQLAEKEQEIERKNKTIAGILDNLNDIEDCEFCEKVATSFGFSNCVQNCSLCAENYYNEMNFNSKYKQAKISFALEQLEKVKEFFLKEERDDEMDTDYVLIKENWEIAEFLLDQIEELKKEMK